MPSNNESSDAFILISTEPLYFDRYAILKCATHVWPKNKAEREKNPADIVFSLGSCRGTFLSKLEAEDKQEHDSSFPPDLSFKHLTLGPFKKKFNETYEVGENSEYYFSSKKDPQLYENLEKRLRVFEAFIRQSHMGTKRPTGNSVEVISLK